MSITPAAPARAGLPVRPWRARYKWSCLFRSTCVLLAMSTRACVGARRGRTDILWQSGRPGKGSAARDLARRGDGVAVRIAPARSPIDDLRPDRNTTTVFASARMASMPRGSAGQARPCTMAPADAAGGLGLRSMPCSSHRSAPPSFPTMAGTEGATIRPACSHPLAGRVQAGAAVIRGAARGRRQAWTPSDSSIDDQRTARVLPFRKLRVGQCTCRAS